MLLQHTTPLHPLQKDLRVKNSIKTAFLVTVALIVNACSASVSNQGDASAQAIAQAKLDANEAIAAATGTTETATATSTPTQRPSRPAQRPMGPALMPNVQQAAYATPAQWTYPSGSNEQVSRKVAVFDSSRSDCNGGCVRFAVTANSGLPTSMEKASAISITVDGIPYQIDYFGNRAGRANGDYAFANGKTAPSFVGDMRTPPLFVAPAIKNHQQGIRIRLDDPGEHSVMIAFYYEGARDMTFANAIVSVPYYFLIEKRIYRVSIQRTNYWFQEGSPT